MDSMKGREREDTGTATPTEGDRLATALRAQSRDHRQRRYEREAHRAGRAERSRRSRAHARTHTYGRRRWLAVLGFAPVPNRWRGVAEGKKKKERERARQRRKEARAHTMRRI